MRKIKTTTRVVSPYGRVLQKAVIYFLSFNKISLISSLKSVINTAITAMNRLRESIMVSLMYGIHPHTQLNIQKKSPALKKRTELNHTSRLCKTFLIHLPNGLKNYSIKTTRNKCAK
ncbi:hypothetical protein [Helicobacter mesocricetorum]|uniref:hypothetical protein n=1 Tax=Helicobacter mesocricetorum TaxID=87012 RepID=UPI00131587A9|nr:hypothetical protein [Helicobacter mesocricetorum]